MLPSPLRRRLRARLGPLALALAALALLPAALARGPQDPQDPGDPASKGPASRGPVRVFVLAGQSNMEGQGRVAHLEARLEREPAVPLLAALRRDGAWVERDDVAIRFEHADDDLRRGGLTVGYGARPDRIGPELGFGQVVGEALDAPVLLIKCAWGGASLREDFRPPSSGGPGGHYTRLVEQVRRGLAEAGELLPGSEGVELAGLVWFQGWNDMVGDGNPDYTEQLAALIHDLRREFDAPDLPVVIGELGQGGVDPAHEAHRRFREQQRAVAAREDLAGTVAFVPTAPRIPARVVELFEVWQRCNQAARKATDDAGKEAAWAEWKPLEAEWERRGADRPYHYYGSGEVFWAVGVDFGEAMLELLDAR